MASESWQTTQMKVKQIGEKYKQEDHCFNMNVND